MHKHFIKHVALSASLALALAACSGGNDTDGQVDQADVEFQRLLEDARYEMQQGNLAEAGGLFDEALAIDRDNARLWVDIARLRFRGGEHVGALEAADLALELDPQFPPALLMRAQLVRDAYGLDASLDWFERALSLHPENADLLAEYAGTLGDLGRNRDMLAAVRKLAVVDPRDPRVHFLQAVLAARANDPVLASSLLKRSGLRDDGVPAAIVVEALAEIQQGNYDTAATSLEELLERQPGNMRVMELLVRSLWLNGRDREIVDRFADRAAQSDSSPYLTMLVGRSYERLGQRERALPLIRRGLAGGNDGPTLLSVSSQLRSALPAPTLTIRDMIAAGNASGTSGYSRGLGERFPGSSDILALTGDAALARGDVTQALREYSAAAQIRRPWPLTKKIIHAYREAGDQDAADALLARHLRAEPMNTEALTMLAQRSASDEDWLRVAVLLDNAIERGAGNDLKILGLRLEAANALEDYATATDIGDTLDAARPKAFVMQ